MKSLRYSGLRILLPCIVILVIWGTRAVFADDNCYICGSRIERTVYRFTRLGRDEKVLTCGECARLETTCYICTLPVKSNFLRLADGRLLCSDDGIRFYEPDGYPLLVGEGALQTFGVEDCRVTCLDDTYYLTFTAVSGNGVGVGLRTTTDWKKFQSHGMILPPHNKDCAIFEEKINGLYYALHRPSSVDIGGNYIWLASSPDGIHWGNHQCIIKTRKNAWDSARVGAGAAPIKTAKGWLEIYHGANDRHQYCLGAFLLDIDNPAKVIARTEKPVMVPAESYELSGFFGHVVFTNGHIVHPDGDTVTVYYGASDEFVCAADFSIQEIFSLLKQEHAE